MTDYEAGLDESVINNPKYEFRLRAMVELAAKDPEAIAMQFTNYDDMTDEERAFAEELGRRGQVIVRDRRQPVSGLGHAEPRSEGIAGGHTPHLQHVVFTDPWKIAKIRPLYEDANPSRTNHDFCEYDEPTKTYRYTKAWVQRLIKKCSTPEGFQEMTGREPKLKPALDSAS